MTENARRGGQLWAMELEKEKDNERSEERGRRRDGETGTASKSKTSLALPRHMPIYPWMGGREAFFKLSTQAFGLRKPRLL